MILVDNPNAISVRETSPLVSKNNRKLQIPQATGEALDLFYRYGFFSLSVRVVPRDDPGGWLVREPTNSVFTPESLITTQDPGSGNFEPFYQVYLCDDTNELMEAYFRDFKADGVAQPYKLYTGSWRKQSSFILVKLTKLNRIVKTAGDPHLKGAALNSISNIVPGKKDSVLSFINDFGSHYIKEILIGDVIYQVFALSKDQFANAKTSLKPYQRIKSGEFNALYENILAPWNIRETGTIQAASGDFSLTNIFEFKNDPTLMRELEDISTKESEAVIGLHFASLRSAIPSTSTQDYFDEVVDTQMALWEINIS
ncbi:TSL [Lepeophtheirus salmonis]|uniref:TSL n=1 Tax=Lepeophtheirus salmonis TaxID=72036 RepID=A0A7R8CL10_LEPSM|nr:TSL [Lepeophtheirus salmonis]CAF2853178.1 TSL [Lepeophtheirus salmonis]